VGDLDECLEILDLHGSFHFPQQSIANLHSTVATNGTLIPARLFKAGEVVMESTSRVAPVVGRFLIAVLFLASAVSKLISPAATIAYLAHAGLPLPSVAYAGSAFVELTGGLLLLIGFQARIVAAALAVFTVLAAVFFHNNFAGVDQSIHFMKNLAITGGLLQIVAFGAGAFSLDASKNTRAERHYPART
jgi:putative oxidoreductase